MTPALAEPLDLEHLHVADRGHRGHQFLDDLGQLVDEVHGHVAHEQLGVDAVLGGELALPRLGLGLALGQLREGQALDGLGLLGGGGGFGLGPDLHLIGLALGGGAARLGIGQGADLHPIRLGLGGGDARVGQALRLGQRGVGQALLGVGLGLRLGGLLVGEHFDLQPLLLRPPRRLDERDLL